MTVHSRVLLFALSAVLLFAITMGVSADENVPWVIESQVLVTDPLPESISPYGLMIQATGWTTPVYRYVLTITNLTPWPITSLRVLDRYFAAHAGHEITHEWFPDRIAPGQATCLVIEFSEGAFANGCHQLEIRVADGLDTILMDCYGPSATTIWSVPLSEGMAEFLSQDPLTLDSPEGVSKLGIHVTRNHSPQVMEFVRSSAPAVVVAVGDLGWLAEVKETSPETVTVGRFEQVDQTIEGDPIARAREFVRSHAAHYAANPSVDYWLGWNEPVIDEVWQMHWYATFEAERARAMAELGLRVAIGNFSAGTPEADEFAAFLPAVAVAKELGGIMAVHEYSAPTLFDGVGAGIPGFKASEDCGALTLRYRFWYDHYLRKNDLVIPLVIAEAGIDGGVLRSQDEGLMGWRDFYRPVPGSAARSIIAPAPTDYLDQLSWYDDELRRDPYVLGFAIFNVGDTSGKWKSFDVTDILPHLGEVVREKF